MYNKLQPNSLCIGLVCSIKLNHINIFRYNGYEGETSKLKITEKIKIIEHFLTLSQLVSRERKTRKTVSGRKYLKLIA